MNILAVESIKIPAFLTFIGWNNFDGNLSEVNLVRGDVEVGIEVFLPVGNKLLVLIVDLNLFALNHFLLVFVVDNLNYLKFVTFISFQVFVQVNKQVAAPLNLDNIIISQFSLLLNPAFYTFHHC